MQVTFVMTDHEIFPTVIRTVPLLWYVQKFQFLAKVKATSTGEPLDSMPRNDAVVEPFLWLPVVFRSENYQHHKQKHTSHD
jgi:hypothetical protein